MAKTTNNKATTYGNPPQTLNDHPFFGLVLDDDQKKLVDAVWSRNKKNIPSR